MVFKGVPNNKNKLNKKKKIPILYRMSKEEPCLLFLGRNILETNLTLNTGVVC